MKPFAYHAPTAVYFSENCLETQQQRISHFGKKCFIITSPFSNGCKNIALEDTMQLLDKLGIEYTYTDRVVENPTVESVKEITEAVRSFDPNFIFAIGGGSALDTAKAVNVLLKYRPERDPYEIFYTGIACGTGCSCGVLPLLGIPTTAGSGSEVMGYAVLTRADTQTKLRIDQLSYFDASFLDAKYIEQSPQWLLDAGAMDALCHGIEGYVSRNNHHSAKIWHDYGMELFAEFKDNLLNCSLTKEDFQKMLISATFQGMALMQSGTILPHGMGYPLTHFKHINHGLATCMTTPAYLRSFNDKTAVNHILETCGFKSLEEFEAYINVIVSRNVDITVTREEIERWTDEFCGLKDRIVRHPEPVTREMVYNIYIEALAPFIV